MKRYVLIAGVNGAGKTTLYNQLRDIQMLPRINTDEIVRSFGDWRNKSDSVKADLIAVRTIKDYFEKDVSFNQETTLCGRSILKHIQTAKNNGYFVEVHYIGLEHVEIAKERVHKRVLDGGHGIPDEDIERRFEESFVHMKSIMEKCDLISFYDNTSEFRRIAIYKNGKFERMVSLLPKWFKLRFME